MSLGDWQAAVAMLAPVIRAEINRELGSVLARLDRIEAQLGKDKAEAKRNDDAGL